MPCSFSLTRRSLFGSILYGDPPGQSADDLKAGALDTANKTVFVQFSSLLRGPLVARLVLIDVAFCRLFFILRNLCLKAYVGMKAQSDALLLLYEDWSAQQRFGWI